ncbi:hypothetical protein E2C01_048713 [Portunus trituberculatus]|uniref:Uncharacterized protein n=1 Tax=Portunus trituberculatus TaxID=210409 RepID=A0A5B7GBQ9_PORTR|nr:hypothetical protein [Portunus trituberculatus]
MVAVRRSIFQHDSRWRGWGRLMGQGWPSERRLALIGHRWFDSRGGCRAALSPMKHYRRPNASLQAKLGTNKANADSEVPPGENMAPASLTAALQGSPPRLVLALNTLAGVASLRANGVLWCLLSG